MRGARAPLVVTGFGLGAFVDGIVLHQVLQWHHLVSAYEPVDGLDALQPNTSWDGVFHLAAWLVVLAGVVWTVGLLLIGWGAFHVVDQVVFHLLLEAHHIRMVEDYQLYDWGYTAIGVALSAVGWRLARGVGEPAR